MSTSPSPEEREQKDKADRAREAEEQAKLPYKWTQTIQDVDITIPVAGNLKGRDIIVEMKKATLKVAIKGQDAFIDVSFVLHTIDVPAHEPILNNSSSFYLPFLLVSPWGA